MALILIWTLQLYVLQAQVLSAPFKDPSWLFLRWGYRFGLDLCFVTLLVSTVPRRLLYAVLVGEVVLLSLVGVYVDFYGRLPSLAVLLNQAGEGATFANQWASLLPPARTAILLALFAVKAALVFLMGKTSYQEAPPHRGAQRLNVPWRRRYVTATYAGLMLWGIVGLDPLSDMKTWGTTNRYGVTYGFAIPWLTEAYFANSSSFLERAKKNAQTSTDRLTPIETPFPVRDRIVFLQIESLDWGVIDYRRDGEAVTPNFNALKRKSMFYKAEAAHFNGSADADFVALMGVWPSPDIVTYKIDGYPFDAALPRLLKEKGYETVALHGVASSFYDRGPAFEKMGIQHLLFMEGLKARGVRDQDSGHDWIQDGELFAFAEKRLSESEGKQFHFLITVTSHGPFDELPESEASKCKRYDTIDDRYFCSMRYVDRVAGRYIDSLPKDTTLVVYADHNSSIELPGYASGRKGDRDWIPVFVHDTTQNLALTQATRERAISTDGTLSFVDVMQFVHGRIRAAQDPSSEHASVATHP